MQKETIQKINKYQADYKAYKQRKQRENVNNHIQTWCAGFCFGFIIAIIIFS